MAKSNGRNGQRRNQKKSTKKKSNSKPRSRASERGLHERAPKIQKVDEDVARHRKYAKAFLGSAIVLSILPVCGFLVSFGLASIPFFKAEATPVAEGVRSFFTSGIVVALLVQYRISDSKADEFLKISRALNLLDGEPDDDGKRRAAISIFLGEGDWRACLTQAQKESPERSPLVKERT